MIDTYSYWQLKTLPDNNVLGIYTFKGYLSTPRVTNLNLIFLISFILPIHETQINDSFINPEKFRVVISICHFLHAHL